MIISSNIPALNSCLRLKNANSVKAKATEKLSSGLRISTAANDAAGLSISEKMRAQIRGLNQARRNVQDGISFIQVAEGALGEVIDILQNVREKLIQASNGTLTPADVQHIFAEIDESIQEIDNIANHTEFHTVKVLRPPIKVDDTPPVIYGKTDIVFIIDKTGSMGGPIDNVKANAESFVNMLKRNGVDVRLGLVAFGDINDDGLPLIKSTMTSSFSEFETELNKLYPGLGGSGGDTPESGLEAIMDSEYGALTFDLRSDASKNFIFITDAPVHSSDSSSRSVYNIDAVAQELVARDIKLTMVGPADSTRSQLERLSGPTGGEYLDLYGNFGTQLETLAGKISEETGSPGGIDPDKMATLILQVGANSGQHMEIELFDARSANLGVNSISASNLGASIVAVDGAIATVSGQRSSFGAHHNRLEHILSNLGVASENLQAAESRIRDLDMAEGIMAFTKSNIVGQVATAMLAHANVAPQSVLQLLK